MKKLIVLFFILFLAGCSGGGGIESSSPMPISRSYSDNGSQIQFGYMSDRINVIDYASDKVEIAIRANSTQQYQLRTKNGLLLMNAQAGANDTMGMFRFDINTSTYWYENGYDYIQIQLSKLDQNSFVELSIDGLLIESYYLKDL